MGAVGGHPGAGVAVEHGEPADSLLLVGDAEHRRVGVLHLNPPSLQSGLVRGLLSNSKYLLGHHCIMYLHGGESIAQTTSNPRLVVLLGLRFVKKSSHVGQDVTIMFTKV